MCLSRPTISAIESGQRKVTADELAKFSKIYGVSTDELMYGKASENAQVEMFARAFSELSDTDRMEIMNLIEFKRRYKETILGYNMDLTQIIFVGGGAGVMKRFGGLEQKNIRYLEDVKANAKGYEMLGNAYLAQAQKRKIG